MLLSDESFLSHISAHIKTFLSINRTPDVSNKVIWEAVKTSLRGEIISFAAYKNKCSKQKQTDIANQILNIDKQYANSPSPERYKERLKLQAVFNLISSREVESHLLRSKSNYYEHGGKTGKLLAAQLRGLRAKQLIAGVWTDNGGITSDQKEINDKFKTFYSNLYSLDCTVDCNIMENFFNNLDLLSLSQDLRNNLDAPITQEEISAAISSMQSGKSPGPDGLPSDLKKKFSADLTPLLCSVFSDSLNSGALPPSFDHACISLKKGKDPLDCTSYRPISLLNTDVKILAKILARRLEDILPSVISPDQTGFIKRCHSFYNIRRLFLHSIFPQTYRFRVPCLYGC